MNDLYRRIDSLLEERARDYPRRVEPLFSTLLAAMDELASALREAAGAVEPVQTRLSATPVVVCGYYRSGTTLMHGLLQSHPDVLALPSEARWFGTWRHRLASIEELHDGWIRRAVAPDGIPPFWSLGRPWEGGPDRYLLFTRSLLARRRWPGDLLGAVAAAFADAHETTPSVWMEKTPGDELHRDEIVRAYPDARFVQLVRDPRATIASIRGWNASGRPLTSTPEAAVELRRSLELARSQEGDRYVVVRYEDLVEMPEREMRRVADILGLPWSDALVTPATTANSSVAERRVRGSIHRLSADPNVLPRVADAIVRALDAEPARALGYDVPQGSAAVALATRLYLSATARARALARGLRPSSPT